MTRERRAGGARKLIDRGAAGSKVRHHLRRHFGRIGRHALRRHAVIAGEDENLHALQSRRRMALPVREKADQLFKPAEASRRLGQRRFARGDGGARGGMPARQIETERAQRRKTR